MLKVVVGGLILSVIAIGAIEDDVVTSFYDIDMNDFEEWPVRFGLRFWDDQPDRHHKISKSLGQALNTGLWPTLWEVSSSAPAPWYADDERMDLWVATIYRNLYQKHDSMRNASYYYGNYSIDIIGQFLGVPEAYSLSVAQKKYRAEKAAEKEGTEPDLASFYVTHNGLDADRIDDLGKFFASSVDHLDGLGVPLPFVELFSEIGQPGEDTLYVTPKQVAYLVNKARDEMDARNLTSDRVKIMAPGVDNPKELKSYLKALAQDKEAYDKLFAITTHFTDNGEQSLANLSDQAIELHKNVKTIIPEHWERKRVVVTSLKYRGQDDVEYQGMRYHGDINTCYEDKHQRTGHKTLKDSMSQTPAFAVRSLASITLLMSHGLPWVVYDQAADTWWNPSCNGLIDKNNKPKQLLAALETFIPFLTNETFPVKKQWKNIDDCYISAFRSTGVRARFLVTVTNYASKVCERSFSLKGIDLWDIRKATIITYNNGTVEIDADRPYRALVSKKSLSYDLYDEDDGSNTGPEIEFDLTVGPYASATAVIDTKSSKGKNKKKKAKKDKISEVDDRLEELDIEEDLINNGDMPSGQKTTDEEGDKKLHREL